MRYINILLAVIFISCLVGKAFACSCAFPKLPALSNTIFSGKVIDLKFLDNKEQNSPEPRIIVTFKVYKVWSGPKSKKYVIHTVYNKWTCNGYYFEKDNEYFVVAFKRKEKGSLFSPPKEVYDVKLCGGTLPLNQAGVFIKQLGPGKTP